MKLELHPLLTIHLGSKPGTWLVSHLLLLLRCAMLSLFVYVSALKSWSQFPGDTVINWSAKCLAYPVFLIEKPLLRNSTFANYFHQVPNGLGLAHVYNFPKATTITDGNSAPSGFFIYDIHFEHPHFALHMTFFAFWYYLLALLVQKIVRKLRPNP